MNDDYTLEFYDALEDCLDALHSGARTLDDCLTLYPQYADDLKPDLQAAILASRLKSPAMPTASVNALEARLLDMLADGDAPQKSDTSQPASSKIIPFRPPVFLSRIAVVILIAVVIALGSGGGVVAASADSMPGETLYPVKRLWESIIVVLASITGQLDDAWLQLAETRFKEAQFSVDHDTLTPEMIEDLWEATRNAIDHAGNSPELQVYLTVLAADLQNETILAHSDETHAEFINLIVPVMNNATPADQQGNPSEIASTATREFQTTSTPTMTATPTQTLVPASPTAITEFDANAQLTLTVEAQSVQATATFTATSRIPPTPTRTPTPTVTSTATPLPQVLPSATITPLPPPTMAAFPTASEGGTAIPPTVVYRPGEPTPYPTWFPYIRLTQDAFYLTRTAEWQGTTTP